MPLRVTLVLLAILVAVTIGGVAWKLRPATPTVNAATTSATFATTSDNPESSDVDTQNNATVTIVYRPDLSAVVATFDLDIKSSQQDLTKYDYQHQIELADGDINPLQLQGITALKASPEELQLRMTSRKYPGNHLHVIVKEINGIHDRVMHLYTSI